MIVFPTCLYTCTGLYVSLLRIQIVLHQTRYIYCLPLSVHIATTVYHVFRIWSFFIPNHKLFAKTPANIQWFSKIFRIRSSTNLLPIYDKTSEIKCRFPTIFIQVYPFVWTNVFCEIFRSDCGCVSQSKGGSGVSFDEACTWLCKSIDLLFCIICCFKWTKLDWWCNEMANAPAMNRPKSKAHLVLLLLLK